MCTCLALYDRIQGYMICCFTTRLRNPFFQPTTLEKRESCIDAGIVVYVGHDQARADQGSSSSSLSFSSFSELVYTREEAIHLGECVRDVYVSFLLCSPRVHRDYRPSSLYGSFIFTAQNSDPFWSLLRIENRCPV